jgi:hypothetical protein
VAAAAPATDELLHQQMDWLGTQALAFGWDVGELRLTVMPLPRK